MRRDDFTTEGTEDRKSPVGHRGEVADPGADARYSLLTTGYFCLAARNTESAETHIGVSSKPETLNAKP